MTARGGPLVATRRSAALADAGARHDLPLGELRTYMDSMRADCGRVRIESWEELDALHGRQRGGGGADHGAAAGRARAMRPRASPRLGLGLPADQLHPRRARGLRCWTASTCPARSARSSASPRRTSPVARPAPGFRALLALEVGRARACSARALPRWPPSSRGCGPGCGWPARCTCSVLDRVERLGYDVLGSGRAACRPGPSDARCSRSLRAIARDPPRHPRAGPSARRSRAPTPTCWSAAPASPAWPWRASWRARGADVLMVDRYEIGERQTSACAAPTPWLHAMGVEGAIRQEIPHMSFHTPHGSARYRLPWSWSAFDYRELCRLLFEQCDARFEIAKVRGRGQAGRAHRPRRAACAAGGGRAGLAARAGRARLPAARGSALARARGASRRWRHATWTCGSTARSCAAATAGACPRAASSAWARARMSRATT